jgi:hypothetical protein
MKADGTRTVSIGRRTVVGLFLGGAALFWILEAVLHVIVFHEGTFVTQLFTTDPHELGMRSAGSILIALLGVFAERSMAGRRRAVEALRAREEDS